MNKVLLLMVVLLVGCKNSYPQDVRDNFMGSCTGGQVAKIEPCQCALDKTQRHYTYEEFSLMEGVVRNGGAMPDSYVALIAPCLKGAR